MGIKMLEVKGDMGKKARKERPGSTSTRLLVCLGVAAL